MTPDKTPASIATAGPGDEVTVKDAFDHWHDAVVADYGVEGTHNADGYKIHDFPVVWVKIEGRADRVPWPIEDVRWRSVT